MAVVGLLFIALSYPNVVFTREDPARSMQFSLYVTLGVFLLLAFRDSSASRSLIEPRSLPRALLNSTARKMSVRSRSRLVTISQDEYEYCSPPR